MFEYETRAVSVLAESARRQYESGSEIISVAGVVLVRNWTITAPNGDTVNAIRALLVAMDSHGIDTVLFQLEEYDTHGFSVLEGISELFAESDFDIVENEDGSAHAVAIVRNITRHDTTAVTIRKADGTVTVTRQTPEEALAVIVAGQRKVLEEVESGTRKNYRDDIDAELVTN